PSGVLSPCTSREARRSAPEASDVNGPGVAGPVRRLGRGFGGLPHRGPSGRRGLGADVVDAGDAGRGAAAVARGVALVARRRAPLRLGAADGRAAVAGARAVAAAAVRTRGAALAVLLAGGQRPEAAHGQVGLVLPGEVEGRVARV